MSPSISRLLSSLYITFILLYLMSPLGATFNGVVVPDFHQLIFGLIIISLGLWAFIRWRKGWQWHRTAFDIVFVFCISAFVISVLANMDTVRRSMIGLWYMLTYVGVWYALHDMLSNGGVTRKQLIDALLNAGILIMLFSVVQVANAGELVQPVSLIGNTNALGAILVGMTPFAVMRVLNANHPITRTIWSIYSFAIIVNLLLTLSRGAWLGMFGSLSILAVLLLIHHEMLSIPKLKMWWIQCSQIQRRLIASSLGMMILGLGIAAALLINSFSIAGRTVELRTRLWNAALEQFSEKPITGQGFYTFGHDYPLSATIPYQQSHAHAHSVPLNILAEMGLIGFAVFIGTALYVVRIVWLRWKSINEQDRLIWIPAIAAMSGYGIHHLFDLPSMMPVVALVGLLVLILVCAPYDVKPLTSWWRKLGHPIGMMILWIGLLGIGLWSSNIYSQYLDAMRISFGNDDDVTQADLIENYRMTVTQLDAVVAQDPLMPVYLQQQAFVYGLMADMGEADAIHLGIDTYRDYLILEPNHSISWANLSVLYWQLGNTELGLEAIDTALELASFAHYQSIREVLTGARNAGTLDTAEYAFNQNYARFEFLREPLPTPFLPQMTQASSLNG